MDQLKLFLQNFNLCDVCLLRFTCDRGVAQILRLLKEQDGEPVDKKVAKNPCSTCLGLLDYNSLDQVCFSSLMKSITIS